MMQQNEQIEKKMKYLAETPKILEALQNETINKKSGNFLNLLNEIELFSSECNNHEVVHIVQVMKIMTKDDCLPCYFEGAFLQLIDEIQLLIQTPTQIQYRLPKIKDEKILQLVKDYNSKTHPRTILIIDGDLLFINKTARSFTEAGFTVLKSNRGKEGLRIIMETMPDCIVFGLNLMDVRPEEFIKELQSMVSKFFVPIIAIGDKSKKSDIENIKFQINDTVEMPFLMDDLFLKAMRLIDQALRMKNQVNVDELTGIYSRKFIMERVEYYLSNQKEKEFTHSLAIFDLDYFKHVNDKYGHPIGDRVLVEFARFISENIRSTDIFARYGGEEFILLFPRTKPKFALKKLNQLREEFSKIKIEADGVFINQTFSGGIASNEDDLTNNPVELLNLADIALYAAKNSGRNRLLTFEPKMKFKKQKSKILVADDDRFTRQILFDGLKDGDWILLEAKDGREALEIANKEFPQLILLDGLMPEMNGYEVLLEIRKNILFKETAVIMLTGNHSDENIAQALYAGADDYITKPFSLIELKARVNRFLVRH